MAWLIWQYLPGNARDATEMGLTVITIEDPVAVPQVVAARLAEVCTLDMDGHRWSQVNVDAARRVLAGAGRGVLDVLAERVARAPGSAPGWVVLALPDVPDYTSLLVLRADPAGGGASLLGDLRAALAGSDRAELRRPVYFEGRAQGLHGVGGARLPFPVLEDADDGRWIRWAGKMLDDERNAGHLAVLHRVAAALSTTTETITLGRGYLLIADQRRIAHGRTALGDQAGLAVGTRRWLVQAKTTCELAAPAQAARVGAGGGDG